MPRTSVPKKFWDPTCTQTVLPRATKFVVVTHVGGVPPTCVHTVCETTKFRTVIKLPLLLRSILTAILQVELG